MKRSRNGQRSGVPRNVENLLWLASGLAESGSRAEDAFWEARLHAVVDEVLASGEEDVLATALDNAYAIEPRVYDELADAIEAAAEYQTEADTNFLLITAPVLAWSRIGIPAGPLAPQAMKDLRVHLQAHVLADGVHIGLASVLFSPDQLPQGYCDTRLFTEQLSKVALRNDIATIPADQLPETSRFLSDIRYVVGVVAVKPGQPVFRWQEKDGSREEAAKAWALQGGPCLAALLPGCASEPVLPDAYFAACRQADRVSRPYSIRASSAFLSTTLDIQPGELTATIAPFHEQELEEYRIGFTVGNSRTVIHGVVWPLLGQEEDNADVLRQIETSLKENGISQIRQLETRFPVEYCDDCGAPLYPSPDGEAVHAELPEETMEQVPKHLH